MECKKVIFILILAVFLMSIVSVSASDVNDTSVASEDDAGIELAVSENDLNAIEDNATENGEILSAGGDEPAGVEDSMDIGNMVEERPNSKLASPNTDEECLKEEPTLSLYSLAMGLSFFDSLSRADLYNNFAYMGGDDWVGGIVIYEDKIIDGHGITIDGGNAATIFVVYEANVTFRNINFINCYSYDFGGAICVDSGSCQLINCNFTNNVANNSGGAVCFNGIGEIINCNFIDNRAVNGGGAVYFIKNNSVVTNCNFYNNEAKYGGAVEFANNSVVTNCNFMDNRAERSGGAVYFYSNAVVTNCNFYDNEATDGGAVYFYSNAVVTNCNFYDNEATYGGAVSFNSNGEVVTCNFANNSANFAGAIYAHSWKIVTTDTCIFKTNSDITYYTDNRPPTLNVDNFTTTDHSGEKLTFDLKTNSGIPVDNGNILISVYYKNNDSWVANYSCLSGEGWAVDLPAGSYYAIFNTEYYGFTKINRTITICPLPFWELNYIINGNDDSEVNLAYDYEYYPDYDGDFVNGIVINRNVTINGNGHTIDARYDARVFDVRASNVTIINLTIEHAYKISGGSEGRGAAIFFNSSGTVENCNFTSNFGYLGGAVFFGSNGVVTNCNFNENQAKLLGGAICFAGSGTVTNCNFYYNEAAFGGAIYSSLDLGVTADTCIFKFTDTFKTRILSPTLNVDNFTTSYNSGEKLTFDLKTNSGIPVDNGNILISVYYKNNDSWVGDYSCLSGEGWTVDLPAGSYYAIFNTEYYGFTKINRTITICPLPFWELNYIINDNNDSEVNLAYDYEYYPDYDGDFVNGIVIDRSVTINGNGHTIDAKGKARVFNVQASDVTISNLTIINAKNNGGSGGAIYFSSSGTVSYCNFTNNFADDNGGAICFAGLGTVTNCNFNDNQARNYGGAINIHSGTVTNCNFTNNHANSYDGGAINMGSGNVTNCNFNDNRAKYGGAISIDNNAEVTICNFANNVASMNGGAIYAKLNLGVTADTCIFKTGSDDTRKTSILSPILNIDNSTTIYKSGEKVTFDLKTNSGIPVDNGNISIRVYYKNNDSWVGNYSCLSGEGWNVDLPAGVYYAIFNTEYKNFEKINRTIKVIPDIEYYANVTPVTSINRTVNITAISNIPNDIIGGELLFILPNSTEITANYNADGTWWAVYEFGDFGAYNVNASYIGLDGVTITDATIRIGADVPINVNDVSINYGEVADVIVGVPESINGQNITITVNGNSKNAVVEDGEAKASFADLAAGKYEITADYLGDDYNLANSTTAKLTVNKVTPEIVVSASAVDYGKDLTVTVQMPIDAIRRPTVTIGDQSKAVTMRNGKGTVKFSGLATGTYNIVASYNGDANYLKASANAAAKVKPIPEIIVSANDVGYGSTLVVTVQMPADAARRPTVTIGDQSKAVTMRNGTGTVKFTGLDVGTYDIVASYNGDADYGKASAATTAKVKPIPEITVSASDIILGEDLVVTVQLPSDVTRRPTVTVGGESKLVTMRNGVGSVKFTGLALGTYSIDVSYSGDANYGKASVRTSVKVNRGPVEINVTANPVSYGEDVVIDVQLPSDVTRRVSIIVGNETKMVSLKNGSGSAKFSGLAVGTYDVSVEYSGDSKYLKSSQNTTVKVNKATPDIQITADDINYGKTLTVAIQLPSDVSRRPTVKIDGVSKIVSLKDGVGSVKFTDLSKGTHEVIVSYDGDANYNKASATTTINVN